ncbi:MAG TPA: lysophospholipid acyltransferase family protein [Anaerolineales bacterium]|nr:lysophospholipid acyltransferase family protein [Anaerolineales bacterium]
MTYSIKYPRKVIIRSLLRFLVRGLFPLLAQTRISNLEKFPTKGPLIVVGNHTGAMEVVLMGTYAPQAVEFMGAVEMPWNGWMGKMIDLYGLIPVYRGTTGSKTMKMGADVLRQGGMLGVFPEGGFWEPGKQKAQSGVAWLSYVTQSPILPIGFGDTRGKLAEVFQLKHPSFEMNVGDVHPPVQLNKSMNKKNALQKATDSIMDAVWELVPEEERKRKESRPENEVFTFDVQIFDSQDQPVTIPSERTITDGSWISRFAHRPNLIDSIRDYIFIPVQVLKELDRKPSAEEIYMAAHSMLEYVERDNPQYFNYRYGYEDGAAFHQSFRQLRDLMKWVMENNYQVEAEARYEYTDPQSGERRVLFIPEEMEQW